MSYIEQESLTLPISTAAGNSTSIGYTDAMNGLVSSVYIKSDYPASANTEVKLTSDSTSKWVLNITNPSTLGVWYYPRAQVHGTTALSAPSSGMTRVDLFYERIKVRFKTTGGTPPNKSLRCLVNVG